MNKGELLKRTKIDKRSKLPSNYKNLSKLIQKYCTLDPLQRSSFANICKRFTTLKKKYLVEIDVAKISYFGSFKKVGDKKRISKDKKVNVLFVSLKLEILFNLRYTYLNIYSLMMLYYQIMNM